MKDKTKLTFFLFEKKKYKTNRFSFYIYKKKKSKLHECHVTCSAPYHSRCDTSDIRGALEIQRQFTELFHFEKGC